MSEKEKNIRFTNSILGYLDEFGGLSFKERPFHAVDALVLCQFSYLKLDGIVATKPVSIRQIAEHPNFDNAFADRRYEENNRALFEKMLRSKRFGELQVSFYVNEVNLKTVTQFSAMTLCLKGVLPYLVFRGTDENLVGWQEDFGLSGKLPIPAQLCSVEYVEWIAGSFTGRFFLGGHSKGGNLAVYAGLHCKEEVCSRVAAFYSFDGPGVLPKELESERFRLVRGRIHKYVPDSSIIGMMFGTTDRYRVVKSYVRGLSQHDPYSWAVQKGEFVCRKRVRLAGHAISRRMNRWVGGLQEGTKAHFVKILFHLFETANVKTMVELKSHPELADRVMNAYKTMNPAEKRFLNRTVRRIYHDGGPKQFGLPKL